MRNTGVAFPKRRFLDNMDELEKLKRENEMMKSVLYTLYDLVIPELPKLMKLKNSSKINFIETNLQKLGHPNIK